MDTCTFARLLALPFLLCILQSTKGDNFNIEVGSPSRSDDEVVTIVI